jgi:phasin
MNPREKVNDKVNDFASHNYVAMHNKIGYITLVESAVPTEDRHARLKTRRRVSMSQLPYEIPAEMRDFAEKSVEQARKAVEGFFGAAHKAVSAVDTGAFPVASNLKDVSVKAVGFAEANAKAAFDHAQKLVHAKDLQEVVSLQTEFLKSQMAAYQSQFQEMGGVVKNAVTPKA